MKKYFKKRIETILVVLGKPQRLFSPEDYHKLRVEIKKIKALFDVIDFCVGEFDSKEHFKPFKSLFKSAGVVRDLQMEIQAIESYKISRRYPDYLKLLEEQRDKAAAKFFLLINDELKQQVGAIYKKTVHFFNHVHKKEIRDYLDDRKEKIIREMKKRDSTDKQMHSLRKQIKGFFYTKKMIASTDIPVAKTEELQELMGTWHDHLIIAGHLKKVAETENRNASEMKLMSALKKIIAEKKEQLFKKINEMKPDFVQSFRLQS